MPKPMDDLQSQHGWLPAKDGRTALQKQDVLIMVAMVLLYLLVALYNLGSMKVPATVWQPRHAGETVLIDLGRQVAVARVYYYCGINENRFAAAKFSIEYEKDGIFRPLTDFEKNDCNIWKYRQVNATIKRLKIIADPPGGALNELAIVEKGTRKPLPGVKVVADKPGAGKPELHNLFDEQQTFDYAPSFLNSFYFDEVYHGRTAYEQLHRMEPYENTHPPLGKLFIASGIATFGMNSFGWRVVGTFFGAALLPIMYIFGKKAFGTTFFAFCAAFLMMVDFMHFTQSRAALIDIFAVVFVTLMYYFMYDFYMNSNPLAGLKKRAGSLLLSGVCFGLGAASKWISLYSGVGLTLLVALHLYGSYRKSSLQLGVQRFFWFYLLPVVGLYLVSFVIIPSIIYLLSYIPFLMVQGESHGLMDILRNQRDMLAYHSQLQSTHPFSSAWWSWPLNLQPVWFYQGADLPAGQVSTIASFGNPAIWWSGIPAIIAAVTIAVRKRDRGMVVIFTGLACQYLPWVFVSRLTFIYHFFSVLPFMILSQVYVMQKAMERWPKARHASFAYLALAGLLFVVFYPVLSGLQVPATYIEKLRWLKSWIF